MKNEKDIPILACKYRIKGYGHILDFVQSIGKIAQEEDVCALLFFILSPELITFLTYSPTASPGGYL